MARKSITVTIDADGRDKGKTFQVTEMSAFAAERWSMRAFLALARANIEIPENVAEAGLAGVAMLGLRAFAGAPLADIEPLMDEMMRCAEYVPDPSRPSVRLHWPLYAEQIEEIGTLLRLKKEAFGLHVDFSSAAALLR